MDPERLMLALAAGSMTRDELLEWIRSTALVVAVDRRYVRHRRTMTESPASSRRVELITTFERDACYYGVARPSIGGTRRLFEFEVNPDSYRALRQILELNPFPVNTPTHAFTGRTVGAGDGSSRVEILVEQGRGRELIEVVLPVELMETLVWFSRVEDFTETEHLCERFYPIG